MYNNVMNEDGFKRNEEIEEALKEFDTLEQPKQMPTALPPMEKQDEMQMLPKQGSPDIQKKNFWQKLWSFYKK